MNPKYSIRLEGHALIAAANEYADKHNLRLRLVGDTFHGVAEDISILRAFAAGFAACGDVVSLDFDRPSIVEDDEVVCLLG